MRYLRRLLGQVTEPIEVLPEYSRNRFAQATKKGSLCPAQVTGVEEHTESGVILAAGETLLGS